MVNVVTSQLVLDASHYPQLRHLLLGCVKHLSYHDHPITCPPLQLNLPQLLTFELAHFDVTSAAVLAACLSSSACPRLQRFFSSNIHIQTPPYHLRLDMPVVQHFELDSVQLEELELRAPRLMDLRLRDCLALEVFSLLPDGDPLLNDLDASQDDAAVDIPVGTLQTRGGWVPHLFGRGMPVEGTKTIRSCAACEMKRINVLLYNVQDCLTSSSYLALKEDPRVCEWIEHEDEVYDFDDRDIERHEQWQEYYEDKYGAGAQGLTDEDPENSDV